MNAFLDQFTKCQKVEFGKLGAIGSLIDVINIICFKLVTRKSNEINLQEGYLNDAWTILWNLTDSNYENCNLFLLNGGLDSFLHSKNRLDSQKNVILMKCMLGPIMNLSEFKDHRGELRKKIGFVQELVSVIEDDFEISYMAIGIIANLALDGPDVWNLEEFGNFKEKILVKMYTWSLESKL